MPKYLQVHFTPSEKKEIFHLAFERGESMTAIVRQAVKEFLIKHKTETNKDEN